MRIVPGDGRTSGCPNQVPIVAHGGWEVCDAAHRAFVMKKSRVHSAGLTAGAFGVESSCPIFATKFRHALLEVLAPSPGKASAFPPSQLRKESTMKRSLLAFTAALLLLCAPLFWAKLFHLDSDPNLDR